MANYFQQWAPQFTQNTEYQPVHNPHSEEPPSNVGKPSEFFIQDHQNQELLLPQSRYKSPRLFRSNFGGLKRTLVFFLCVALSVLLVNIFWLLYAKTHYGGIESGYGIIQRGDCNEVKKTNTWLHLLINILSTLLLTGSNAFMSTYSCPSRKEVDRAHARKKWLHVGMLSFRNLTRIAKRKSLVVILLCLSSVPFHLLYNSMVFVSLSSNNYYWAVATEDFANGEPFNLTGPLFSFGGSGEFFRIPQLPDGSADSTLAAIPYDQGEVDKLYAYFDGIQQNASKWETLSNYDCIKAYSNVFLAGRRNVILVSSQRNDTNSILKYDSSVLVSGNLDNNWWICSSNGQDGGNLVCQPDSYLPKADEWTVFGYPIDHCLSEQVEDVCEVEFSLLIMILVISFNLLKVLAMSFVLWRYKTEHILTSVGDAAASFLAREDDTTRGMCLADRVNIKHLWRIPGAGLPYSDKRLRWAQSVNKGKWTFFALLLGVSYGLIALFGAWGFSHTKKRGVSMSFSSLWQLGFGTPHQDAIVIYDLQGISTIGMAVLANLPQIFLAMVWLLYMGIITTMFLASDWARYSSRAQSLMVSSPKGEQRSMWFLGAPFAYGSVLLVLQIILHWLISQAIFVISIMIYNPDGSPAQSLSKFVNCGYSPIAIIFSIIGATVIVMSAIALSMRRFPTGAPPVVATCSAAISSACHLTAGLHNEAVVYEKLLWGQSSVGLNGVAHCSLVPASHARTGQVQPPIPGRLYSGLEHDPLY
ncbi:uncharacterized protein PV09_07752 [Verruconis gallopava]|uniref:DUF6536 domain-containing protein n=1 Tax=Verruconis gallopava TaxID=253628 RepID=A0A0D1YIS3_9PEZI|nr:uncharacterized protein PV09_07752 [Verruconis gallopava]KIW00772.1 hypothetical protein PV09_07752 [Verruconis gallopava]